MPFNKALLGKILSFGQKAAKPQNFPKAWRYELFFKKVGRVLLTENSEKKYLKVSKSAAPVSLTALV